MADIAARLDTIERAIANLPEWSEALADLGALVAALRAVLDTDLIRREIQAEIEDSTDTRGHINHFDYLPDRCADRIHTRVAAALGSA